MVRHPKWRRKGLSYPGSRGEEEIAAAEVGKAPIAIRHGGTLVCKMRAVEPVLVQKPPTVSRHNMANHDVVVIGASAGGVQALQVLTSRLPGELRASVFIVLHM